MTILEVPINEQWLAGSFTNQNDLRRDLQEILAAKLYELGRVTLAQGAEMAGLPVWDFMEKLSKLGVSVINQTVKELQAELNDIDS